MSGGELLEAVVLTMVVVVCLVFMIRSMGRRVSTKDCGGCSSCAQGNTCGTKK